MKRRRLVVATVAATVVALASAGLAGGSVQAGGARGVTDDTIQVAGLVDAAQFATADTETGARAAFEAAGPINGRTIELVEVADDKHDPNTDLSEGRRLVQQEQVFAIVPTLTPTLRAGRFFEQQHVPFFGWGIDQSFCKNDYAFGFTGCVVPPPDGSIPTTGTTWGSLIAEYFKAKGETVDGKTAAVIAEDLDTGKTGAIVIKAQAEAAGLEVVYAENPIPTTPPGDYSPFVNDIMSSNDGGPPDVVFLTVAFPNVLGLSTALREAGFEGILTDAVAYDPSLATVAEGQSVFTQFDLPEDTESAEMQQVVADLKAFGGEDVRISQVSLAAYFSANAFVEAVKKAGKNLTPESLAKAMKKFTYEIEGVVGPTKYPKARTQGAPCGVLVESDGSQYNIVVPYDCYKNINYKTGKTLKY